MPKYKLIFCILALATLILGVGCSDRGSGLPSASDYDSQTGFNPQGDHIYDIHLALQLGNITEMWLGATYIPKEAIAGFGNYQPVPTLILLPPQGGDKLYYFRAGLFEMATEMISTGEIEPMVIHCPSNTAAFGGMFYGNSLLAGEVDSIISLDMIDEYLPERIPATIQQKSALGIGGIGMGAYGAMRAALKNTTADGSRFASVSVANGPLDFDGSTGNGGLMNLFDIALAEQLTLRMYTILEILGIDTVEMTIDTSSSHVNESIANIDTSVVGIDTTFDTTINFDTVNAYDSFVVDADTNWGDPIDTFTYRDFDTGDAFVTLPISKLFIGGSVAFSPHDIADSNLVWDNTKPVSDPARAVLNFKGDPGTIITDSSTMIDGLIGTRGSETWSYHLPFDSLGLFSSTIWSLWMANNIDSMYFADGGDALDGSKVWIGNNPGAGVTPDFDWSYGTMTTSFIDFMKTELPDSSLTIFNYSGVGASGTLNEATYDLVREMLKFHSGVFNKE